MSKLAETVLSSLEVNGKTYRYYSLPKLNDPRVAQLPYSIRILLESALRNADDYVTTATDIENILNWNQTSTQNVEIPFRPARVLLQDFTGVPCVVDLAAMREAVHTLGGDPNTINPLVPVDLVIDHSVQVDEARTATAIEFNLDKEMARNQERFSFLKWGSSSFNNLRIVPPGSGIVHQVNLEYLARVVFDTNDVLYPDSVVGTDSHTTMVDGLGVAGWGVGGIEAEAVMLGQHLSMILPQVVGFELTGTLASQATATDVVLIITQMLRQKGVVGKFVEFYGPGVQALSLADRATIANMAPEYGATMGFFPLDSRGIDYLATTGRSEQQLAIIEQYLREQNLFITYQPDEVVPHYNDVLHLDLSTVQGTLAGPKRPHDAVALATMQKDFQSCLTAPVGFKGYGLPQEEVAASGKFTFKDQEYTLKHGSIVIAAITSCTNTSNPAVLLGAGLLAKNAVQRGLKTLPYIKTSLAPGSHVATKYLEAAGLAPFLDQLGFNTVGYGCTTCIGNSGDIPEPVESCIVNNNLVASAVLSGNRNFEGRVHPNTRANYLASPPLVVAYALAGTVDIDFATQPIGVDADGKEVFLSELWPSRDEIQALEREYITKAMFQEVYSHITDGNASWRKLAVAQGTLYPWDEKSTYIHQPPFFAGMGRTPQSTVANIDSAYCLLNLGDSITTDHISPAGKIAPTSPAGLFLQSLGVNKSDFNSYGARRGNDLVLVRGTFANPRIVNKLLQGKASAKTLYVPTGEELAIYDAAARYRDEEHAPLIVFGGNMYGSGSSRDWAAKGPFLQGVRAVIAQSFERIHRSNLVGMGVLPLEFLPGESADSLGLTGKERYSIDLSQGLTVAQELVVTVQGNDAVTSFRVVSRLDTAIEVEYYQHGGILQYVIRKIIGETAKQ